MAVVHVVSGIRPWRKTMAPRLGAPSIDGAVQERGVVLLVSVGMQFAAFMVNMRSHGTNTPRLYVW